ncbi:MAG: hypothetical protein AAGA46_03385 [Cyanobacteria bacterium P01_F01_bin.13]
MLSQYSSLIKLAASFGWSNMQIKKELSDLGIDVSPQAIGRFIKVNGFAKRSKAEAISHWFQPLVIQQREQGGQLKAMASYWGIHHTVMSQVFDLLELPGDERCSVELLINAYPSDLEELKTQEYSLRQVQQKLEQRRGIRCALETIRKAMSLIVSRTMDDWPETRALATLLTNRPEGERKLIWAVVKKFAKTFGLD